MSMTAAILETTPRRALDTIEKSLGIPEDELAQALKSNPRTLKRWRAGIAHPQQLARRRLAELLSLEERARQVFKGRDAARRWFHIESRYLGGMTPAEAVRVGRLDRVEAALDALDAGVFV
jgi:uncharacterized protein (DUF2384 family)